MTQAFEELVKPAPQARLRRRECGCERVTDVLQARPGPKYKVACRPATLLGGRPVGKTALERLCNPQKYITKAQVAQLVEHVTENHGVGCSIHPLGTIVFKGLAVLQAL